MPTNSVPLLSQAHRSQISVQFEIAVLLLVRTAARAIRCLATLLTPIVGGRKDLTLIPVAGTCKQV